jgi:hypothetical protein
VLLVERHRATKDQSSNGIELLERKGAASEKRLECVGRNAQLATNAPKAHAAAAQRLGQNFTARDPRPAAPPNLRGPQPYPQWGRWNAMNYIGRLRAEWKGNVLTGQAALPTQRTSAVQGKR